MKYINTIVISKSLEDTIEQFNIAQNNSDQNQEIKEVESISGEIGEVNSVTKIHFKNGKRNSTMTKTILEKDLPSTYRVNYDMKGVCNEISHSFQAVDEQHTRYTTHNNFTFKGVMVFFSIFIKGSFKKQSKNYIKSFRKFAEKE